MVLSQGESPATDLCDLQGHSYLSLVIKVSGSPLGLGGIFPDLWYAFSLSCFYCGVELSPSRDMTYLTFPFNFLFTSLLIFKKFPLLKSNMTVLDFLGHCSLTYTLHLRVLWSFFLTGSTTVSFHRRCRRPCRT